MKCNFCGREVPKGTEECPYCHYRFEQEATILNPHERDEFEGVTIDESGYEENAAGNNGTRSPEYRQTYEYRSEEYSGARSGRGPKIYVKNLGCGGGYLRTDWLVYFLYAAVCYNSRHRPDLLFHQQLFRMITKNCASIRIKRKEVQFLFCA